MKFRCEDNSKEFGIEFGGVDAWGRIDIVSPSSDLLFELMCQIGYEIRGVYGIPDYPNEPRYIVAVAAGVDLDSRCGEDQFLIPVTYTEEEHQRMQAILAQRDFSVV